VMPASVADAYAGNSQMHVPLITGWNGDEGFVFGMLTKEEFAKQAKDFGPDSNLFKKYFPAKTDSESVVSQIALAVDKTIGVSQYAWAMQQNKNQSAKTFLYLFTRKPPAEGNKRKLGAYHTAEIGYALHNLDSIRRAWEPIDRQLEKQMSAYWVQFVKTGNPNGPALRQWDSFTENNPQSIVFGDSTITGVLPNKQALDFLYARFPGRRPLQ
jgi:para-nitrobenzyl esterase